MQFHTPHSVKTRGALRKEQSERSSAREQGPSRSEYASPDTEENVASQPARSVVKTEGSERSKCNSSRSSTRARRQQLILEATAAKAAIEKDLIEKKLAADLAALEEEKSEVSEKSRNEEIEKWIDDSHVNVVNTAGLSQCAARDVIEPAPVFAAGAPTDIDNLANALHRVIVASAGAQREQSQIFTQMQQLKDLPSYSGDPIEWLHFKRAYDEAVDLCKLSENEKVYHLRRCLRGEAKEAVSSLLMCGANSDRIVETLELRFGRPEYIIMRIVAQLKRMTPLSQEYHRDIAVFATKIQNFVAASHAIQETDYLRSPELTATILSKLPSALVNRWMDYIYDNQRSDNKPKFELLSEFLMREATKVAKAGVNYIYSQTEKRTMRPLPHSVHVVSDTNCNFCKMANHPLQYCTKFKRAMRRDRWRFIRIHRLCHKCLTSCQDRRTCPAPACDVDDCGRDHHRLLHWSTKRSLQHKEEQSVCADGNGCETVTTAIASLTAKVLLKIVPVTIHGPHKSIYTYALLDDGATVSLISADIANEAGLHGKCMKMRVRSAWESSELECESELVNFNLSNCNDEQFVITARKINKLQLPVQSVTNVNFEQLHKYKTGVTFNIKNVQPKILIGQDNYHLLLPIECVRLRKNGPYVTRTPLGWSVHGALRSAPGPERAPRDARDPRHARAPHVAASPLSSVLHVSESAVHNDSTTRDIDQSLTELSELVRSSFALDAIGIGNTPRPNKDEQRAVAILADTATLVNGQWEVGLPWKSEATLPESYPNAYRRLMAVERKNIKYPDYGTRYTERMTHLFENGYAREVPGSEPAKRTWYLPHFAVDNPNKKKMRVVFDAAATSGGHSLNDYLLQGPDLLESLLGIMFRFREGRIAVTGDIKDMFLRIKIRSEDQNALRFLWRNNNPRESMKKYAMTSLIFGANCSPFIAQFVKNLNAQRFAEEMPEAVNAILKSHYMDDYIDSMNNVPTAKQLIDQITHIHRSGGFEIRNWSSNEPQVTENKPKEILSNGTKEFRINDQERTLGLFWFLASDTLCIDLTFKKIPADILRLKSTPTKREVLRIVMSIYDVYGFLAPLTVKAKILLRLMWKENMSWDTKLTGDLLLLFNEWVSQLQQLKDIRIPRWYFYSEASHVVSGTETDIQLHVFCDASPSAYAAVAYWRKQYSDGSVCVSLIACKTRVAPIKNISIPRLELQAALLACRLAHVIEKEHRIAASKKYYWCDSTTVLHWIKNENRNYNIFIANRLGEIDTLSRISEWHYIPTCLNIADAATKLNKYKLTADSEWFRGPSFLYTLPADWPQPPVIEKYELVTEEIIHTVDVNNLPVPAVPDPNRFSVWNRLRRSTAAVLLFIEKCMKTGVNQINCNLLRKAEILLLKYSQALTFSSEIQALMANNALAKNSRLRSLTPFLDKDGLLRVGGRIDAAQYVSQQAKQPVILDGQDRIARLITKYYHEVAAHGCNEMVVNELRQRYWITRLRPTVRTVASQCMVCRLRKINPKPPRMGDLPEARLMHHHRPFTSCGVDLFGPMDITIGRRREKRYGVLFTCLTVRAIHIEIVSDLSTDTLIMALRRMAARRGWPVKLFSDNGTNFRGADKELKRSFAEVNTIDIQEKAADKGVEWNFIPPGSPHMGGAWERLIRSVKTALRVTLKERAPREETLVTMLLEVEAIVNSRPLTHVSTDCHYEEALTPNHFLIGTASPSPIPGSFGDDEFYLRRQWRIAQRLTDMFWRRWVKEVLPALIPRKKWLNEEESAKPGSLVLICDPNLPRNTWLRGLIVRVHPGKDGRVRVVDVKTKTGILTRPITRVALFPTDDECLKHSDGTGRRM